MTHDDQKLKKTDVSATAAEKSTPEESQARAADKKSQFSSECGEPEPLLNLLQQVNQRKPTQEVTLGTDVAAIKSASDVTLDTPIAIVKPAAETTQEPAAKVTEPEKSEPEPQMSEHESVDAASKKGFMGGLMNKAKGLFGISAKAKPSTEVDKKSADKAGAKGDKVGEKDIDSVTDELADKRSDTPGDKAADKTPNKPADKPLGKLSGLFGKPQAQTKPHTQENHQPVAEKSKPPVEEPLCITYAIESPERPAPLLYPPDAITHQELAAYTTSEHGAIATGESPAVTTGENPAAQAGEQSALSAERPAVSAPAGPLYVLVGLSDTIDPKMRSTVYQEQLVQPYSGHLSLGQATIPTGTYMPSAAESLVSIAEKHLGPGSTQANHEAYVREVQQVNGLQQATEVPAHHSLVLPGHSGDGGFMITDGTKTLIKYRDGRKTVEENADRRKKYTQELAIDGSLKEQHGGPGSAGGFFVTRTRDGKAKYYEKEGSRPYNISSDTRVSLAHIRLHELAEQHISDPGGRSKFEADMAKFEDGANLRGYAPDEILHTYEQLMRLMDAPPAKKHDRSLHVPAEHYVQLAQEILSQVAEPKSICQSLYSTASTTPIESLMYTREPSKAAKLVADVGLSGSFTTANGTTVILDIDSLKPHPLTNTILGGDRTFATQLFNCTAINLAYRCAELRSSQESAPPERRYAEDDIIRTCEGDNGEHLYARIDGHWKVVGHMPALTDDQVAGVLRLITGLGLDPERGALLVHEERNSEGKLVDKIADEQALFIKLTSLKQGNSLPIMVRVHTGHEPFFTESGNDTAGGAGDWHIVTIMEFLDGLVAIDNHWQANSDDRTKVLLPHQLYVAMRSPETALAEAERALEEMRAGDHVDVLSELDVLSLKHRTGKIDDATYGSEVAHRIDEVTKRWEDQKRGGKFDQKEQDTVNARLDYLKSVWKQVSPEVLQAFADGSLSEAERKLRAQRAKQK
jgi:hypothetical protein